MGLKVITPPAAEQITIAVAAQHLKLYDDGDSPPVYFDQDWVTGIGIPAAREYCEGWTQRALATQTLELALDAFSDEIQLLRSPVQSITSVKYIDGDGTEQTLATNLYTVDSYQEPSWLLPAYGTTWPATQAVVNAVKVRYVAGYDLPGANPVVYPLPFAIKAAMLLTLGHLYENRQAASAGSGGVLLHEIPLGVDALLRPYQLRMSMA